MSSKSMSVLNQLELELFKNQILVDVITKAADEIERVYNTNPATNYRPQQSDLCIYQRKEGKIISFLLFSVLFNGSIWIGQAWTDPMYRGQGHYKAMFAYLEILCKKLCIDSIHCGVLNENISSQKVHEKLGMERVETYPEAIHYRKRL